MSRLILKQHGVTRLQETSPLAIGQSVAALREPAVIQWRLLHHKLGLDTLDWFSAVRLGHEMALEEQDTLH